MTSPADADKRPPPSGGPLNGKHDPLDLCRSVVRDVRHYAVFMLDAHGRVVTWNCGAELIEGYAPPQIIGSHFSCFYPPADIEAGLPQKELSVAAAQGSFQCEGWRVRKGGAAFWASAMLTALHHEDGRLRGFLGITRDLSEQRRHEEALRESEERFRLIVGGVTDYAIFSLDPGGNVTSWNAGARHIKGYEAHEIIGRHFSTFYTPEAIGRRWPEHELRQATTEGRFEDEGWRLRKDGTRFWANVVITALRDSTGTLVGFSKITRDLSERRRHEEALRRNEERFRLLVEGVTGYAILMLDANGLISSWNAGAQRILGFRAEEILWKHFSNLYRAQEIATSKPWHDLAAAKEQGGFQAEGWRVRSDGTTFWGKTLITALRDGHGRPYGYAHVTQDLTQQRHTEALEEIARRMNEFIAMLGHELRNPLAPIRNAVSLMERKGLGDPVLESMRATISRQTDILARIVDELLDVNRVARGQLTLDRKTIDLAQVVSRAIEASRPLIERREHMLHVSLPGHPIRVHADALRLTQVIANLLNNAAKYTARSGQIWLTLEREGLEAELRVRDNGIGIGREVLPRIFDLFFQGPGNAEPADRGLGVGLALVQRIIELHGGRIEARSDGPGRGSEFVVSLTTVSAPIAAEPDRTAELARMGSTIPSRRIVVADDNVDAANSLASLLEVLGQQVRLAYDGVSAIATVEQFRPQIVMLDIGMPALDGYEVARRLRALPAGGELILVAVTGWGQDSDKRRALEVGFDFHFVKPVSDVALRRVLSHQAGTDQAR